MIEDLSKLASEQGAWVFISIVSLVTNAWLGRALYTNLLKQAEQGRVDAAQMYEAAAAMTKQSELLERMLNRGSA